ncbi:hypothetical protein Purlil1_5187 [Purpureocillium lilacinum]|uniref:Uncharacterized protein n=1 Tax=Purpureocillium lilacinum TaxID=33203 RepID=A0ABR0C2S3_PURLI|nr:hypothetical protein Purlil1_5187 [Purpureocillium lilacinum]
MQSQPPVHEGRKRTRASSPRVERELYPQDETGQDAYLGTKQKVWLAAEKGKWLWLMADRGERAAVPVTHPSMIAGLAVERTSARFLRDVRSAWPPLLGAERGKELRPKRSGGGGTMQPLQEEETARCLRCAVVEGTVLKHFTHYTKFNHVKQPQFVPARPGKGSQARPRGLVRREHVEKAAGPSRLHGSEEEARSISAWLPGWLPYRVMWLSGSVNKGPCRAAIRHSKSLASPVPVAELRGASWADAGCAIRHVREQEPGQARPPSGPGMSTDLFLGRLPPFGVGRASRARWTEGPIIGSAGAEAKAVGHVRGVKMRLLYGFLQRSGNQTTVSVCVPSSACDVGKGRCSRMYGGTPSGRDSPPPSYTSEPQREDGAGELETEPSAPSRTKRATRPNQMTEVPPPTRPSPPNVIRRSQACGLLEKPPRRLGGVVGRGVGEGGRRATGIVHKSGTRRHTHVRSLRCRLLRCLVFLQLRLTVTCFLRQMICPPVFLQCRFALQQWRLATTSRHAGLDSVGDCSAVAPLALNCTAEHSWKVSPLPARMMAQRQVNAWGARHRVLSSDGRPRISTVAVAVTEEPTRTLTCLSAAATTNESSPPPARVRRANTSSARLPYCARRPRGGGSIHTAYRAQQSAFRSSCTYARLGR